MLVTGCGHPVCSRIRRSSSSGYAIAMRLSSNKASAGSFFWCTFLEQPPADNEDYDDSSSLPAEGVLVAKQIAILGTARLPVPREALNPKPSTLNPKPLASCLCLSEREGRTSVKDLQPHISTGDKIIHIVDHYANLHQYLR